MNKLQLVSKVYAQSPKKQTLLLIHGMGSASTAWKPILDQLCNTFTVVTVDLPGHGQTPMDKTHPMDPQSLAQSVFDSMNELGFESFHLVGNSLGGWIALEMAGMRPHQIRSVTGLAPAGLWLAPFNARYPGTALARMLSSTLWVASPLVLHFEWGRKMGFSNVSPRWKEFSYETCLDATNAMAGSAGYYPAWDALLKKRYEGHISSTIPMTIIFGDSDRTLPASTSQERSLVPSHARWLVFAECGHAPMWDHPKLVVDQILITAGAGK